MNLLGKAGMVFLIILNVVFIVLGIALIIAGGLLREKSKTLDEKILPLFNDIGLTPDITLGGLLEALSVIVIIIGVVAVFLSSTGAYGSCCKNRPLLIMYAIGVLLIIATEIYVVKSWFDIKNKLNNWLKSQLLDLLTDYSGYTDGVLTVAWNAVFLLFNCCGVNAQASIDDFASTSWASQRGSDVIPGYCCKEAEYDTGSSLSGTNCTTSPTSLNSYIQTGCYTAIEEILTGYSTTFITICFIILLVECIAIVAAVIMIIQITNDITANRDSGFTMHSIGKTYPVA